MSRPLPLGLLLCVAAFAAGSTFAWLIGPQPSQPSTATDHERAALVDVDPLPALAAKGPTAARGGSPGKRARGSSSGERRSLSPRRTTSREATPKPGNRWRRTQSSQPARRKRTTPPAAAAPPPVAPPADARQPTGSTPPAGQPSPNAGSADEAPPAGEPVAPPPPPPPAGTGRRTACSDGLDNDQDGKVDLDDPHCDSPADTAERVAACEDGLDNDEDGKIDLNDPQCSSSTDTAEVN